MTLEFFQNCCIEFAVVCQSIVENGSKLMNLDGNRKFACVGHAVLQFIWVVMGHVIGIIKRSVGFIGGPMFMVVRYLKAHGPHQC